MRKWLIMIAIVVVIVVVIGYVLTRRIPAYVQSRTDKILQMHFKSNLQYTDFRVSVFPRIHVTIGGLVLRHEGRTDVPPLIELRQATMDASIFGFLSRNPRIARIQIEGLQIHMPPRGHGKGKPLIAPTDKDLAKKYPVLVEELDADDVLLAILNSDPDKQPRDFQIHRLRMHGLGFRQPASFHAQLTNPKPEGEIDTWGKFGPWQGDEPSETPIDAQFTFDRADLGTLKGLSGILSSKGKFSGPLDYLQVEGETDTPDFALRTAAHPVDLRTHYTAVVDGTNGDTYLQSVTATFGNTTLDVKGSIVDMNKEIKSRTIVLDAVSEDARVEDLIRLVVKSDAPVMTGAATLRTHINIPEGDQDLIERLQLNGQFGIAKAHFTNSGTQEKINSLSRRAKGTPNDTDIDNAVSALQGEFHVRKAVVSFSNLSFEVPGAAIHLDGTYDVDSGDLDFRGHLLMKAKLSQTQTGAKSFFMKVIDPFFKGKDGMGTSLPIKITGTKDHPAFGLNLHDKDNKSK